MSSDILNKASNIGISAAPITYLSGAFYLFGGLSGRLGDFGDNYAAESTVGRFDITKLKWTNAGELKIGRFDHNAIFDGEFFVIVGGSLVKKIVYKISSGWEGTGRGNETALKLATEKCSISNDKITCTSQEPSLAYYHNYPELFLVSASFCTEFS